MAIAYLVGNGINRAAGEGPSWQGALEALCRDMALEPTTLDSAPFPLAFHELAEEKAKQGGRERDLRESLAVELRRLTGSTLHRALMERGVRHVLTTNYDHSLENSCGGARESSKWEHSRKYSLFRHRVVSGKRVWHIHGDIDPSRTVMLGYDHYVGSLHRMRQYLRGGYRGKLSPFHERQPFEVGDELFSWLDVFFRDDIQIVGLTLDYAEIDLWWLLTYKQHLRRGGHPVGQTVFWCLHGENAPRNEGRERMLGALSVKVQPRNVVGNGWTQAWEALIAELPADTS